MKLTEKRKIDKCNRLAIPVKYLREFKTNEYYIILEENKITLIPVKEK